jgi:3-deoxy-D-manno-octulosonic-acid transferase
MRRLAYSLGLVGGVAAASPLLLARLARGRYRRIAAARLGLGSAWLPRVEPGGIWVHALSVGEVRSALPLLRALGRRFPGLPRCLSVATAQGLAVAREELAGSQVAVFVRPLDLPWAAERLARRLRPRLAVLVEGDIWPGWQWALGRAGAPRLLVNGRVSPRTFWAYRRAGRLARGLFEGFERILVQTRVDERRLQAIGVPHERLAVGGNLKFDSAPPALEPAGREELARELGMAGRPVLVAGSTHPGEEEPVLDALVALRQRHPGLALVLAPREVSRGSEAVRLARARGLAAARASRGAPAAGTQVVVLDVLGRLAEAYSLGRAAFVGGSLAPVGGHNLLEPAAQGVPAVFGPHTHNFLEMARELEAAGGGRRIQEGRELARAWGELLDRPGLAREMGAAAREFCRSHRGAVRRSVAEAARLVEASR